MISVVNTTTHVSESSSGSFNLSNPSTIGNYLFLVITDPSNGFPNSDPTTNTGEVLTLIGHLGGSANGNTEAIWAWYLLTTKVANSISFNESSNPVISCLEVSGVAASPTHSEQSNTNGASSSSFTPASFWTFGSGYSGIWITPAASGGTGALALSTANGWSAIFPATYAMTAYTIGNGPPASPIISIAPSDVWNSGGFGFVSAGVSPTPSTTTLTSNPSPSAEGIDVVFSVGIHGAGTPSPSGTVTFNVDGSNVAIVPAIADGIGQATAQWQTTTLAIGNHSVYAVYSGDTVYATSTSPTIIQVVVAFKQTTEQQMQQDFGNSTADVIWWHTGFTGIDDEILGWEGWINEGGTPNIPWLLGLSVSQGNAMTEAIARGNIAYLDNIDDGGGGGNESGAQMFGGAQSGGLEVSW
jgi:Big-like domain-containing protein